MRLTRLLGLAAAIATVPLACGSSDGKKAEPGGGAGEATAGAGVRENDGGEPDSAGGSANTNAGGNSDVGAKPAGGEGGGEPSVGGSLDGAGAPGFGGAPCDAPVPLVPPLTGSTWLICGATAENGRVWDAALTFDEAASTCSGASLSGAIHWLTTNNGVSDGKTLVSGNYDATTKIVTLEEYEVTAGNVVTSTDTMRYDAETDTLVDGAWTCSCSPGSWTVATRAAAGTDVDSCP